MKTHYAVVVREGFWAVDKVRDSGSTEFCRCMSRYHAEFICELLAADLIVK